MQIFPVHIQLPIGQKFRCHLKTEVTPKIKYAISDVISHTLNVQPCHLLKITQTYVIYH